ncbi:MAG: hypothetical protein HKN17_08840, partial [Rhodothermales bacterium]|nr:hypothetical protein [Rhodothermales bacterium]
QELSLARGDGAGISDVGRLNLTFLEPSEILLFDLGMNEPMIWK